MSTQLDPVTGAPLLTPDLGNIDQLPYKVQPVPLADQTNQPQLGRTYLYPDDVPPVLANINAMNGTQPDQAQTLHTDGDHRLLVASSGGASFSGTAPYLLGGDWDYHSISANSGAVGIGGIGSNQYLYSFDLSWFVSPSNATWPVTGLLSAGFYNNSTQEMPVIVIGIYANSATDGSAKAGRESRVFLPVLELANSGIKHGGSGYQLVIRNETTGDLKYNVNIITSPT